MICSVLKFLKILTLVLFWILGLRINGAKTALNMFHFHLTSHSFHFFSSEDHQGFWVWAEDHQGFWAWAELRLSGSVRTLCAGCCCSGDSHVWLGTFLKCEILLNSNNGDRALVAGPQLESGELSYVTVGVRPTCGPSFLSGVCRLMRPWVCWSNCILPFRLSGIN